MSWQRVVAASDGPITGHSEMDVHRTAVIEHDPLMLGPLFDGDDRVTGERRDVQIADLSLKRGMKQLDARDLTANCHTSKAASSSFDFGKLRHRNDVRATDD
jgi:hypothetical protein